MVDVVTPTLTELETLLVSVTLMVHAPAPAGVTVKC
jgi:hypothetical protein